MNNVLMIISIVLLVMVIGFTVYFLVKSCKDRTIKRVDRQLNIKYLLVIFAYAFVVPSLLIGISLACGWKMEVFHLFLFILGGLLFGFAVGTFIFSFVTKYYMTSIQDEEQKQFMRICMFASIPVILLGLWLFSEGLAPYLTYPLYNRIAFGTEHHAVEFVQYYEAYGKTPSSAFSIAFYGIIIVTGAVIVYFICDHRFYKIYHKHGILDACFLIAFPMGIIGARLWFCLVLKPEYYFQNPGAILNIMDGGLAIMGGAILGIISGVTYMLICRRYINIRQAMDIIVPCILIAQSIGRWGNFFNQEVYGSLVSESQLMWVPTFVRNQMKDFSGTGYYIPLFLIESITNMCGYFVIRFAIGKPLEKYLALGDLSGCYLIWYGITRAIMEPLRYGDSGQQDKFMASWYSSFGLIAAGVLLIVGFHVYELIMKKKFNKSFDDLKCIN